MRNTDTGQETMAGAKNFQRSSKQHLVHQQPWKYITDTQLFYTVYTILLTLICRITMLFTFNLKNTNIYYNGK
jgi:hypothetical protein